MDHLTLIASVEDPLLEIRVQGDFSIKGSDDLELVVKTESPEETVLEQNADAIRLSCPDDCKVLVPRQSRLHIISLEGDGIIKAVEGEIQIDKAAGDLTLRSVGSLHVNEVFGRLEGKNIMGNLEARQVKGNLVVRDVQGDFSARTVYGNLVLDDVDGSVEASVHGNATLRMDPTPGAEYFVKASGNLTCSLPEDASAELSIKNASRIMINFPGIQQGMIKAPYTVTLAEGDAKITFEASGNVTINSQSPDFQMPEIQFGEELGSAAEAFAEQITRQIDAQMQMLDQQLNAQLANLKFSLGTAGMTQEQIERFQERARQASERASERAQEKLQRAQERLERKLAQVQRNAERQARTAEARARASAERAQHHGHRAHIPWAEPPKPVDEPVQDAERLLILRMLQEKKITMEEAQSLLSALEEK
jgi:hypothetical protein